MTLQQKIIFKLAMLLALSLALFSWASQATANPLSCYGAASVGFSAATTEASEDGTSVDFGSEGTVGGVGAGCDVKLMSPFMAGAFARYDFGSNSVGSNTNAKLGDTWTLGLRGGVFANDNVFVYALAGLAGTEFDITNVANTNPDGIVYGVGAEMQVDFLPVSIMAEVNRYDFGTETIAGARVDNKSTVVRVGVIYRFFGGIWR